MNQELIHSMITALAVSFGGSPTATWTQGQTEAATAIFTAMTELETQRVTDLQVSFSETLEQIGQSHAAERDGWENEAKTIEAERDGLAEQLRLSTETVERLTERTQDYAARTRQAEAIAADQVKLAQTRLEEIDRLRDDLHRVELENAGLRGYNDRVREFDPLSDRELTDRDERPLVPAEGYSGHRRNVRDMASMFADGPSTKASEPWYRRRAR